MRYLNKRIFRSLKAQWSKNLFLFILMFSMISITSGMLVSSGSIKVLYYDLMSKGIVEDGKILFAFNPTEEIIKSIEETNVKTEKSPYIDAQIKEVKNDKAHKEIRIYKNRTNIYPLKFTKTDFVYGLCTAIAVGAVSYLQFSNIF